MIRGAVAIFSRDFKKFLSNPFVVIMTLMMPIMYLVIFGNAMGGTISHIPVAVVQEGPPYNATPLYTSAVYELNHISQKDDPKLLDVTVYSDESVAKHDLAKGLVTAVIVFPSEVSNDHAIRLYVDSSNSITPSLVQAGLNGVLAKLMVHNTVLINKIYGDIKYIQFFGVGVIMMAIFTSTMFGGGIALIKDRENGIHEGYLVTPVKRTSII
ncbi:MAG: ABC transporter permease, partial [Methanoregula sp.]